MTLIAYEFGNYRMRKTWLDKCLKSNVSQRPLTISMLNGGKYLNLYASFFIIAFHHYQNAFSQFFAAFLKITSNFEHFVQNMALIADVFPKVETAKDAVS